MKVLLVGGLGFIGRRFIRKFSSFHDLIIYAKYDDILKIDAYQKLKNIKIEEGGIEDKKIYDIIIKHKPDVVIHLAALTGLKKCYDNPERAFMTNVYGTFNVVNACIVTNSKLIFISSREVYGDTRQGKSNEDDPLLPNNTYGITKMLGENLVKHASKKYGIDYTILRLTNVYGPEGDQYGVQIIIKNALTKNKIEILGGSQRMNFVFVDDVADVMNLVLDHKNSSKQIFNVGSNDTITIKELANKVSKLVGGNIKLEYGPMRETETSNFEPDTKKLEGMLWNLPRTTIEKGLEKTIKWYRENEG